MKILVDKYIPYIQGALDKSAEVTYLAYNEFTPETVKDADALIVRTRTRCNRQLLEQSNVKFIASATIGYDHIDGKFCDENNIKWTNAPGCNALSVAQYIASVLCFLSKKNNFDLRGKTIGIVGVGAVGSKIEKLAKSFGMNVLLNDPPRARKEGNVGFVQLKDICEKADIITFHTLLNMEGDDRTFHLGDENFFNSLKKKPIIINAARGEILDTNALLSAIKKEQVSDVVIDCWENEPNINLELLEKCTLATPHIAGYSADGKANAAMQSVHSISKFFNLGLEKWKPKDIPSIPCISAEDICDFFLKTYNIQKDSETLKKSPETFEQQRSHYPFRREPKAYLKCLPEGFLKQFHLFFE
ncbi:Erythronate-4-phosphate dehydrogenase [uncultured Paludibacter sp.]|nr:Erythronate-4-phosphate dehydrogenase [uncultured Paludibacter sp.]